MITLALAGSLILNACFALVVLKLSLSGFSALSESHERTTKYTENLVDRLMANDYATYQDRRLAEQIALDAARAPVSLGDTKGGGGGAGYYPDGEATSLLVSGPDKGGFGSRLGLAAVPPDPEAEYEAADQAERGE